MRDAIASIHVTVKDNVEVLRHTLPRLAASIADRRHELVVVDDASTDPAVAVLLDGLVRDGAVRRVLRMPESVGVTEAIERAFDSTTADYLVHTEDDMLYHCRDGVDWVRREIDVLEDASASIGAVCFSEVYGTHPIRRSIGADFVSSRFAGRRVAELTADELRAELVPPPGLTGTTLRCLSGLRTRGGERLNLINFVTFRHFMIRRDVWQRLAPLPPLPWLIEGLVRQRLCFDYGLYAADIETDDFHAIHVGYGRSAEEAMTYGWRQPELIPAIAERYARRDVPQLPAHYDPVTPLTHPSNGYHNNIHWDLWAAFLRGEDVTGHFNRLYRRPPGGELDPPPRVFLHGGLDDRIVAPAVVGPRRWRVNPTARVVTRTADVADVLGTWWGIERLDPSRPWLAAIHPVTGMPVVHALDPDRERELRGLLDGGDVDALDPARLRALAAAGVVVSDATAGQQRAWLDELRDHVAGTGYAILRGLLDPYLLAALRSYYRELASKEGERFFYHPFADVDRLAFHNEPVSRLLHAHLAALLGRFLPRPVEASYTYLSIYLPEAVLPRHVDRAACEWNMSLVIDTEPEREPYVPWPIFLDVAGTTHRVELGLGDGVVYRGTDIPHWREPLGADDRVTIGLFHFTSVGPSHT